MGKHNMLQTNKSIGFPCIYLGIHLSTTLQATEFEAAEEPHIRLDTSIGISQQRWKQNS